jgi:hypothetical protein
MTSFFSRLFSLGEPAAMPRDRSHSDPDAAVLADFLRDAAKPKAIDPIFDSLLGLPLRWEIAPKGTLERLPLTDDQREQYDFVATCDAGGQGLYLLDSRPVWAPGIPYIPSFLLVAADRGLDSIEPIGTFDSRPDNWTFAWQSGKDAP